MKRIKNLIRLIEAFEVLLKKSKIKKNISEIIAIMLGAQTNPVLTPMNKLHPRLFGKKEPEFESFEDVQIFFNTLYDIWNGLLSYDKYKSFYFLKITGTLEEYILARCNDLEQYVDILFLYETYDLYTNASLKHIEYILKEMRILKGILSDKKRLNSVDPDSIQSRIESIWNKFFLIREYEEEARIERLSKGIDFAPRKSPVIICGRNDPCPCGSGKKYKHCCMN